MGVFLGIIGGGVKNYPKTVGGGGAAAHGPSTYISRTGFSV